MVTPKVSKLAQYPAWSFVTAAEKLRRRIYRSNAFQSGRQLFGVPLSDIKRPIFIVGTVRSGKTTLAKCLGKHPRIMYLGYELTNEWCDFGGIEIARSHNNIANCPPYTSSKVTNTRRDRVRHGFSEVLIRGGGNQNSRFLDDNPHLWNKLPFVRAIFSDANLIIMSRDIRNTVASTKVLWIKGNATTGKRYYVPGHHEYCWSVIPPAPADELEAWRIFPGGDVAVLAESWVRTYEMIEQTIEGFDSPVLVKLRDFVADPLGTLAEIYETINLPVPRHPLPELDTSRGDGWREILTSQEQRQLEAFIENNRSRIERLKYADTTL